MLQKLRDKTSGWIATVILGLLIIPFAFFGMESYLSQRVDTYAARIAQPPTWWTSAPDVWPLTMLWTTHEIDSNEFRQRFETAASERLDTLGGSLQRLCSEAGAANIDALLGLTRYVTKNHIARAALLARVSSRIAAAFNVVQQRARLFARVG